MSALALRAPDQATEPPEVRGRGRNDVAMLVAQRVTGTLTDARFDDLPAFLHRGDLLVVNDSATLAAALPGRLRGRAVSLHLSTPLERGGWVVELRTPAGRPLLRPPVGESVGLPGGAHAEIFARYLGSERLSAARLHLHAPLADYLAEHGRPIHYGHVSRAWPLDAYQTVFATEPGSAEMPSAGRPFTAELVTELVARGVLVAPVTLHAGVSSLEHGEPPFPERFRVPAATARVVNAVRSGGGRVIAVGTTVVRALETVAGPGGAVEPGEGLARLVVTPERGVRAIDGLLTGWHEADSSHLLMLEAIAGVDLLERSYARASELGHRGHEFGDVNLILP